MSKPPDERSIERLLRGQIREPSDRFEERLRQIPLDDYKGSSRWQAILRPLAVAASLILGIFLFLQQKPLQVFSGTVAADMGVDLDAEWITLLSLAEGVSDAEALTDEELRFALEYYAFNP